MYDSTEYRDLITSEFLEFGAYFDQQACMDTCIPRK